MLNLMNEFISKVNIALTVEAGLWRLEDTVR